MDKHEFPEEQLEPQEGSGAGNPVPEGPKVDFSDLGPLFSPASPEEEVPEEEPIDLKKLDGIMEDTLPEAPIYQAQDYPGALEEGSPEDAVLPGEAAWLLKKLRELPPDPEPQAAEASQDEVPAEDGQVPEEDIEIPQAYEEDSQVSEEAPEASEDPENAQEQPLFQEESPEEGPLQEDPAFQEEGQDLSQEEEVSQEGSEEGPEEPPKKRQRKGRPKRKKGEGLFGIPNLVVTAVWIAITLLIGVTLGRMVWICAADVLAFGREDKPVTVTIYEADTIDDITQKLYDAELIRYPGLFKLYASFAVDEGEIHPGIWDLNTLYDYHALVNMMSPSSSREVVELMIPEGYSCRQIFDLMEEKKICTALDLAAYAANGELDDYWFLEGVERGHMYCLEGFLFPDTYQFYTNDSPRNVLQKMLVNFESRFDESMVAQIDVLNAQLADLMRRGGHGDAYIAEHQFDVRDVVIVASLIEKETSSAEEGYTIASVIYNRLYNWGDHPPLLNIDASIVYALGGKTDLTAEDLKVDNPYNTYLYQGLTPGPIANPGLSSMKAALSPLDTNYYFYVLDPSLGSHRFTTTYEEHQAAKAAVGG